MIRVKKLKYYLNEKWLIQRKPFGAQGVTVQEWKGIQGPKAPGAVESFVLAVTLEREIWEGR